MLNFKSNIGTYGHILLSYECDTMGSNLHPGVILQPGANLYPGANCADEHDLSNWS